MQNLSSRQSKLQSLQLSLILLSLIALSGCSSVVNSNKIIATKTRVFGIVVGLNPTTQVPEVKLGFVTTVFQMIPTSTNSPVFAPKYADYFDLKQSANPFNTGIEETTGVGDVQINDPDSTNIISTGLKSLRKTQ